MKISDSSKLSITLLSVNTFIYIAFALYSPFLSSYYTRAGLGAVQIGVLLTIGPLVAIIIQPIWAILSDKTGRRKDILSLILLGGGVSIYSFYLGNSFLTFFIAAFLIAVFANSIAPLNDAITLGYANKYQLDFSRIRMGGTIGYTVFVVIAGMIVKHNPSIQFVLGSMGYVVTFFIVRRLPKDEIAPPIIPGNNTPKKASRFRFSDFFKIFKSKQVYFMLGFAFISQVGLSFNGSFIGVYIIDLGLSENMIGIINGICALSEIPVLFVINKVLRKITTAKIVVISCLLLGLRILLVTGGSIGFIFAAQALHGITYMTVYFSIAVFISKNIAAENLSKGQSVLTIIQAGAGSIVGNILGGFFVDNFGLDNAYRFISIIIITATIILASCYYLYKKSDKAKNPTTA